ncbi:MAG: hypothetical protein V4520_12380 [Bacteroidota bacterium]
MTETQNGETGSTSHRPAHIGENDVQPQPDFGSEIRPCFRLAAAFLLRCKSIRVIWKPCHFRLRVPFRTSLVYPLRGKSCAGLCATLN